MTWLTGLGARAWALLAAIGGVLVMIGAAFVRGRRSGIDATQARAAEQEQDARRRGDAAAADAQRDGAAGRLRSGRF